MRYSALLSVILSLVLLSLSGCGGTGAQTPRRAPETTPATTTMETTQGMETTMSAAETTSSKDQYGQDSGDDCLDRQFAQATKGMSSQEAGDYETGVIDESVNRQMDPRDIMTERGFSC